MKTDYRLLDTGRGKRLEQFGDIRLIREAKQAVWAPALPKEQWTADAVYDGSEWSTALPDFSLYFDDIRFSLGLLETGQVGIFPEQAENWQWLRKITRGKKQNIINGFAYTGGSTLFASNSENSLTHLDASKPAVKRAKDNAELSGTEGGIRYIVDDVLSFMQKEVNRGKKYQGFIFDPPAFGRGGKGKTWKLNRDLPELVHLIGDLSDGIPEFVLLSAHDPAMNSRELADMLRPILPKGLKAEHGELIMQTVSGQRMQNGYYARFSI